MITDPFQRKAYDAVSAALPFAIDPANITVEPGVSYLPSPIKLHDYAVGVMAAFGSVVEHIGRVRGLPAQTMTLNRRLCGFHLNELQVQLLNGYSLVLDTWPVGADNGTYRTKDGRYVQMIGLFPHMVNPLLVHLQCANTPQAIQAAVEKHTAQLLEEHVADGLNLALGMVRTPQEWLAHPQGAATAKLPLVDIERQGTTKNRVVGNAQYRPLEGVRVVDLTNMVAGPTAGVALAEQGADVIAVRPPPRRLGDPDLAQRQLGQEDHPDRHQESRRQEAFRRPAGQRGRSAEQPAARCARPPRPQRCRTAGNQSQPHLRVRVVRLTGYTLGWAPGI